MAIAAQEVSSADEGIARVPRRLVVFDVPDVGDLLDALRGNYPGSSFQHVVAWNSEVSAHPDATPVWHWTGGAAALERVARETLCAFIYPLVAGGRPFVVAFEFGRETFTRRELDSGSMHEGLDFEDIGALLAFDSVSETFPLLDRLHGRLPLTPIEERLASALAAAGVQAIPQARFGRYVLDFLVEEKGERFAVEADGRGYHDPAHDARRDDELRAMGIADVLRFTGSEIFRSAEGCAALVRARLHGIERPRPSPRSESLDPTQQAAVAHAYGAARVLAPAGAGKTRVLVNRVAHLIDSGVDPSTILCLAFNTKANEQLVDRLQDLDIEVSDRTLFGREPGVRCATFNAFGFRFVKERLGLQPELVADSRHWTEAMKAAIDASQVVIAGTKRHSDPVSEFMRALDRVRADLALPEQTAVELEYVKQESPTSVPFLATYHEFERRRLESGRMGFSDQIYDAVKLLLSEPRHREYAQSFFRHVLVDEFQDLSAAQLALVDIVSRPWRNLFVVGDDDQLIYGWRFAKLTNILDFHKRVPVKPHSETYTLGTNYRCSESIVRASRRVIDNNVNRVPKDIQPVEGAPHGQVLFFCTQTWQERAAELVRFVRERKEASGAWKEIAVLCRFKAQQPFVAMALDNAEIPRTPLLGYRLFSDRSMQRLRTYLELVRRPTSVDGNDLASIINIPNRFVREVDVASIRRSPNAWQELCTIVDHADPQDFKLEHLRSMTERVESLNGKYQLAAKAGTPPSALAVLEEVVKSFELVGHWTDHAKDETRERDDADPLSLLDLIRIHAGDCGDPTTFLERWDTKAEEERNHADVAKDDLGREQSATDDRVVIGTMHSSKGREYDSVVLYDYGASLGQLDADQVEEERRVFYVGMTRGKSAVLLTIDQNKGVHRFVRESDSFRCSERAAAVEARLAGLQADEQGAVVVLRKANDALDDIVSGARRLSRLTADCDAQSDKCRDLQERLGQATAEFEAMGLWDKVAGRHRRSAARTIESLTTDLAAEQSKLDSLRDQVHRLSRLARRTDRRGRASVRRVKVGPRRHTPTETFARRTACRVRATQQLAGMSGTRGARVH